MCMAALIFDIIIQILLNDGMLANISISLVFNYIWFTTGSYFLALVGMLEILLSLPMAWFFLRSILQVKFFGPLNFCTFAEFAERIPLGHGQGGADALRCLGMPTGFRGQHIDRADRFQEGLGSLAWQVSGNLD